MIPGISNDDFDVLYRLWPTALSPAERQRLQSVLSGIAMANECVIESTLTYNGNYSNRQTGQELIDLIINQGPLAILDAAGGRDQDFNINSGQGAWAEDLLCSSSNGSVIPFGPSDNVLPGNPDYEVARRKYRYLEIIEGGKRPDLLELTVKYYDHKSYIDGYINNPIAMQNSREFFRNVNCALEVKSSLAHCGTYRRLTGRALSITLKAEEIAPLLSWQRRYGVPVFIVQVFPDEIYSISLDRFMDCILRGIAKLRMDNKTTKHTWFVQTSQGSKIADISTGGYDFDISNDGYTIKRPIKWPEAYIEYSDLNM